MEKIKILFCPKCQSENIRIDVERDTTQPQIVKISIDNWAEKENSMKMEPAVYTYIKTVATCNECGYTKTRLK